jgi:hypothetical protein
MTTNLNTNVLPLTPNDVAGSPDPNPLVTPQQYASITGDTASAVNDIEENISDVINDLCKELKRTLVYGQYTEAQFLYANGMVYPSATPLDPNQPVTANLSDNDNIYDPATDDSSGSSIVQGDGIWVGFFSPLLHGRGSPADRSHVLGRLHAVHAPLKAQAHHLHHLLLPPQPGGLEGDAWRCEVDERRRRLHLG